MSVGDSFIIVIIIYTLASRDAGWARFLSRINTVDARGRGGGGFKGQKNIWIPIPV